MADVEKNDISTVKKDAEILEAEEKVEKIARFLDMPDTEKTKGARDRVMANLQKFAEEENVPLGKKPTVRAFLDVMGTHYAKDKEFATSNRTEQQIYFDAMMLGLNRFLLWMQKNKMDEEAKRVLGGIRVALHGPGADREQE